MKFGLMYELQIPKPWDAESEHRIVQEATEQVVLGDKPLELAAIITRFLGQP